MFTKVCTCSFSMYVLCMHFYAVNDHQMLEYVCNKTAAPFFSNLVWFIGNHVIELDECLLSQAQ